MPVRPVGVSVDEADRALVQEVTERRRAEANLRLVIEGAPNGIVMVDADGAVVLVNKAAEALFGYAREELVGRPIELLVPERSRRAHPAHRWAYSKAPEARPMGRGRDLLARRKDGSTFPVEIGLNPVDTVAGPQTLATVIDITERKRHEDHRDMLMRELSHRVKNNLAVVRSIARMTARTSASSSDFYQAFTGRLDAIAAAHDLLAASEWSGAEFTDLVNLILHPYRDGHGSNVAWSGPPVHLPPEIASSLSLVLHEMATNAVKYGALATATGKLLIDWDHERRGGRRHLRLRWREMGGPPMTAPSREGFGTSMIRQLIERQLGGAVNLDFAGEGLRWELELPLPEADFGR